MALEPPGAAGLATSAKAGHALLVFALRGFGDTELRVEGLAVRVVGGVEFRGVGNLGILQFRVCRMLGLGG